MWKKCTRVQEKKCRLPFASLHHQQTGIKATTTASTAIIAKTKKNTDSLKSIENALKLH